MIYEFNLNQKIGSIVVKFPKAGDIFKEYKIDFCCGGDRPLSEVVSELKIDKEALINRLNSEYEKFLSQVTENIEWDKESMSKLIDHIVNTHHRYLKEELPVIGEYTTKILRAHGLRHEELSKVHKLFHNLKVEFEEHLIKEEELEFPLIKAYEENPTTDNLEKALKAVKELEAEHEGVGDILKELRRITKDYLVPQDGCNSYKITFIKLQELEADTFQHIHLENNVLFPKLEANK